MVHCVHCSGIGETKGITNDIDNQTSIIPYPPTPSQRPKPDPPESNPDSKTTDDEHLQNQALGKERRNGNRPTLNGPREPGKWNMNAKDGFLPGRPISRLAVRSTFTMPRAVRAHSSLSLLPIYTRRTAF
jgi:hypothetical protein